MDAATTPESAANLNDHAVRLQAEGKTQQADDLPRGWNCQGNSTERMNGSVGLAKGVDLNGDHGAAILAAGEDGHQ